jgi:hypothetical protein
MNFTKSETYKRGDFELLKAIVVKCIMLWMQHHVEELNVVDFSEEPGTATIIPYET